MIELSENPCFALEAGQAGGVAREGGGQNLDGHLAFQFGVQCPKDFAHPTLANQGVDLVVPYPVTRRQSHGFKQVYTSDKRNGLGNVSRATTSSILLDRAHHAGL